jgi:gas vesicle protein
MTMGNFLLGMGIGLTVGVLFAPKSGAETRKLIADKTSDTGQFLAHQGEQIRDAAAGLVGNCRNVVAGQSEKLAGMFNTAAKRIQVHH